MSVIKKQLYYSVIGDLKKYIDRKKLIYEWIKHNRHNDTVPGVLNSIEIVKVGKYSYGDINIICSTNRYSVIIGNYVSIAKDVFFILEGEHNLSLLSQFPIKTHCFNLANDEVLSKGNIIVDDDVWIGFGAIVLSGVHVNQGAVIAAGSVVTKDVPPYTIVGGNPARVIKYRFEPEMIEELLKVDYGKLNKEDIEKHIDDLYTELKDPSQLDWMPKKG